MSLLAKRLKRLREELGLTQAELAEKLNIKRATYARYETGENKPKHQTLKKIAKFYGVSVEYLLAEEEEFLAADGYIKLVRRWIQEGRTPEDIERDEKILSELRESLGKYLSK